MEKRYTFYKIFISESFVILYHILCITIDIKKLHDNLRTAKEQSLVVRLSFINIIIATLNIHLHKKLIVPVFFY